MADFLTQKRMPLAEFLAGAGSRVSASSWIAVTQAMIDGFADVTGDRQFIHIDPVRAAAETPFGGAIAHGFLTLSLLSVMAYEALPQPAERAMGINYGFDKVRFIAPVRAGARVRGVFRLAEAAERKPGELLARYEVTVEIEGGEKPALAAEWLTMAILAKQEG